MEFEFGYRHRQGSISLTFTNFSEVSINLDAPYPHCAIGVLLIVSTSC